MNDEELKSLKKEVSTKKRIATEWASQIHDLVEDRLFKDYTHLVELAQQTAVACEQWAAAKAKLDGAESV